MHKHCSCKYGEESWSEDASLFKTIIVWDITGELVVYQNSHFKGGLKRYNMCISFESIHIL